MGGGGSRGRPLHPCTMCLFAEQTGTGGAPKEWSQVRRLPREPQPGQQVWCTVISPIGEPRVLGRVSLLGPERWKGKRGQRQEVLSPGFTAKLPEPQRGSSRTEPHRYSCADLSLTLTISPVIHSPLKGSWTHTAARDRVPLSPQGRWRWGHKQHCTTTQELCSLLPSLQSCFCHPKCSSCLRALHPCTLYPPHPPLLITMASPAGLFQVCPFCLWFSSVQGSVPCSFDKAPRSPSW